MKPQKRSMTRRGKPHPFPEPSPEPSAALQDFLQDVQRERNTFAVRVIPTQTICLDGAAPYTGVLAMLPTVARDYALAIQAGTILAGDLMRRSAARFLADLENGYERGLYFDPQAARNIIHFAATFCDLPLLPWQIFCLANYFAWKKPSGARRFTESWISCSKEKRQDSARFSGCAVGLICDCETYPDIFSAATKKEQSRLVWRDARSCVQGNQANYVRMFNDGAAV